MDIQKRIQRFVDERGWSEYQSSRDSNLSQITVTNISRRNNALAFPTLEVVYNAFGITLAQFFSDGSESTRLTEQQRELLKKRGALGKAQKEILLGLMNHM